MTRFLRRTLAGVEPYVPGEQPGISGPIKLNTNENPYPPSPAVFEALRSLNEEELRRYPDPLWTNVRNAASKIYRLPTDHIAVGNGSDELIRLILQTFVDLDETVVFPDITYSLYETLVELHGATSKRIPLKEDFTFPEAACAADGKVLFICHPNSPTGMPVSPELVSQAVGTFSGLVVLDEAYADFCDTNFMSLASEADNVLVLRTLSKSYSLCGMRTGLAFGHPNLIRELETTKDSYNVSVAAQAAAEAALLDESHMRENSAKIRDTRNRFTSQLQALGVDVLPSEANFIFVRFASREEAKRVFGNLREAGLLVRYFDRPRLDDGLRISIGTDEQMSRAADVIRSSIR